MATKERYIDYLLQAKGEGLGLNPETREFDLEFLGGDSELMTSITSDFSFWMPNKRYLRREPDLLHSQFYPCESGFPKPNGEEYVVRFNIVRAFLPNSEESSQTVGFRNFRESVRRGERLHVQQFPEDAPMDVSNRKFYNIWYDSPEYVVNLSCHDIYSNGHGTCSGEIWVENEDLIVRIMFPEDQATLNDEATWKEPVNAVLELVNEWHEEGSN